ncbi:MAG: hypothetical protein Q9191_004268, partial [Dirinaria sp. TL-2023a]
VVLANGRIYNVNQTANPDLYFALRGGGNNFGIVTRFDGNLWGGMTIHPITANVSIYKAFYNFANNAPKDPDAALITAVAYAQGQYIFSNDYEYAKPVINPPIFHEFTSIPNITSTMRIASMSDLARELNASNPGGFRETYTTATFKNNADLQVKILEFFVKEVEGIKDAAGILPALVMQPITKDMISHFSKKGGNALGIAESDGPLICKPRSLKLRAKPSITLSLFHFTAKPNPTQIADGKRKPVMNIAIMWTSKSDDARIVAAANRVISASKSAAKAMNLDYNYIYQNYASLNQSVFASYGPANQQRLIQISKKYDPDQVFQKLQPGYFKLSGANGGSPT